MKQWHKYNFILQSMVHYGYTSLLQVTKKLSDRAAEWCTNVSNERGEILQSVLTVAEGRRALKPMCEGLMKRYKTHGEQPPKVLYVDRDCCSQRSSDAHMVIMHLHVVIALKGRIER